MTESNRMISDATQNIVTDYRL